ncbi:heterogeneous nuclear ribonucleoprotein K isoform X1 [Tachypleus tridentatus]|uniref:heterogeneous nuclear ribonucleoprotein K isoform X1 n=2 Tax=Tachypleus tridentatus TaxID=6853 RepID=UPI003FD3B1AA
MTEYEGSMKRPSEDELESEMVSKRPKNTGPSIDARFLIQSKNAGAIIGKAGSNINRLRKDYKASVTVPDCPGPERILTIVADVDTVGDILLDIIPKLEDYTHHRTMNFECELRMLLHQSHAGCVIGRAGFRIKELREKTGASVKIYTSCCPMSTERIVQMTGTPSVVVRCIKEIFNLISETPIKGFNQPYDPHNYDEEFAPEYGGYGEPGRGRSAPVGRGFRPGGIGPSPRDWRDMDRGPDIHPVRQSLSNRSPWRGPMRGREDSFGDGPSRRGPAPLPFRPPSVANGGAPRGGFGGMDGPPRQSGWMSEDIKVTASAKVNIPREMAGAVIGKGGQRIRQIRRDCGAEINIEDSQPGSNERVITISGNPQEIQMAKFLIQKSMREHGGGGGGRRY